jgi:DNA-binding HxlR family transcriptional regulator
MSATSSPPSAVAMAIGASVAGGALGSSLSATPLSDRLPDLAGAGLIARTVDEGPPPAVSYSLTDRGNALMPALAQISLWAQEHLPDDAR